MVRKLWPTCRDYGPDLVRLALIHRQTPPPLHGKAKGEWESLGDLGYLDEAGYLFLSDRRTDLILSGGANIYPAEVEAALELHPAVACAVVVGLPDADLGQRVHAIIELQRGLVLDAAEMIAHAKKQIAPYKVPRTVEFVQTRLRDDAGKVRRSALRDARLASH